VVVENFSAGVLDRYGLSDRELRESNPGLVYASASGLGRSGPQRDSLAYGSLLQAYSGRAGLVGPVNQNLEAMGIMPAWTDPQTGFWEAFAILAALFDSRTGGRGGYLDLSMLEATVALTPAAIIAAALGEPAAGAAEEGGAFSA
jgi:benzylsuccinate CoA-transferase BbsF subunit